MPFAVLLIGGAVVAIAAVLSQKTGSSAAATPASSSPGPPAVGSGSSSSAPAGSGAPVSGKAARLLTSGQQTFASQLAADTGLDSTFISAWLLAEESGGAATSRESAHNNDWLNIGYTDTATIGAADTIWGNPVIAANATAGWLKGGDTIPGYGRAAAGIQAVMKTAGKSVGAQVAALQSSGWASSGYPDLPGLVSELGG